MNIETANRLVELRKSHHYSQEDLASLLGISRQAVSKWERAEASPDTDNLIHLAQIYQISLDEMLGQSPAHGGGEPTPPPTPPLDSPESYEPYMERLSPVYPREKDNGMTLWQKFPYPLLVVILYLVIGFLFGWWHPGWMLFLTIPVYYLIGGIVGGYRDGGQ